MNIKLKKNKKKTFSAQFQNAGAGANQILSDFQSQELRKELQAWCNFVARR